MVKRQNHKRVYGETVETKPLFGALLFWTLLSDTICKKTTDHKEVEVQSEGLVDALQMVALGKYDGI